KNQKLMHRTPSRCRACLVPKLLACPERYKQLLRGLRNLIDNDYDTNKNLD
ncbi:145_t:CDS:2, partial [Rhizophagus irregularis]